MKRIAIIDDETHARQFLRTLLGQLCPEVEVVGEADGVGAGLQLIRQTRPDAVLLDISMEDGSGFDLLEFFPQLDFKVIFTTAHDEFALRAFNFAAIDYLLKPIQPKDLMRAVDRVREMPMLDYSEKIKTLLENARQHRPLTITIYTQEGIILLKVEQIVYLVSDNAYTTFHLLDGEQFVVSRPIGEFEVLLPTQSFFRVHQSYLVNLAYVHKILKDDGGSVVMSDGSQLPIARRRKDVFIESAKRFAEG